MKSRSPAHGTKAAISRSVKTSVEPVEGTSYGSSEVPLAKREIEFASHPANLSLVREFVRQFLRTLTFPETEKDLMVLGLDEACTNVIRYAYEHKCDQLIC